MTQPEAFNTSEIVPYMLLKRILQHKGRKFIYEVEYIRLPNGIETEYGYINHPGSVLVVPVTDDGRFVLVRQYRFALQRYLLEFPGGIIENIEDPVDAVKREMEEETGYIAHHWTKLGESFTCPGYSNELMYIYLAQQLEKLETHLSQDSDEQIEVVLMNVDELKQLISIGNATTNLDATSIAGFYIALEYMSKM